MESDHSVLAATAAFAVMCPIRPHATVLVPARKRAATVARVGAVAHASRRVGLSMASEAIRSPRASAEAKDKHRNQGSTHILVVRWPKYQCHPVGSLSWAGSTHELSIKTDGRSVVTWVPM